MTPLVLIGAALLGLVVVYMSRPYYRRQQLSSARFFADLPPPKRRRPRFDWSRPLTSPPFYLQTLALVLLAAAVASSFSRCTGRVTGQAIGLELLLDTSASMSTRQGGSERMALARREAERVLDQVEQSAPAGGVRPCYRLATFDLERRASAAPVRDPEGVRRWLASQEPRALGTDLSLATRPLDPGAGECPITHRVVISDQPAPLGVDDDTIWRDLGRPVDNLGLTAIAARWHPLSGAIEAVTLEVHAFGTPPGRFRVQIDGPAGAPPLDQEPALDGTATWRHELTAPLPGRYRIRLSPGGAYALDDEAEILIPARLPLRVRWQLDDSPPPGAYGWTLVEQDADLTVAAPAAGPIPDGPLLLVGRGKRGHDNGRVVGLREESPLLNAVDLDAAESAAIPGQALPQGFEPVLSGEDGIWVAERARPPGVYVPGLPAAGGSAADHLYTTLFFNGLRRLLAARAPPGLYSLTSPAQPRPDGTRLALHPDEGRTDAAPRSWGEVQGIHPRAATDRALPWWPQWLVAAAWVLALERLLAACGGARWA